MEQPQKDEKAELARIIESAKRLGVEVKPEEALQWLTSMAAFKDDDSITVSTRSGVFGHKISMLDFSDKEIDYFKRIGRIVEFDDIPGEVETALALSGSSAQSKIQTYPGDCDYFERVNILAPTREQACSILARLMREKALNFRQGHNYQLIEVKFGSWKEDMTIAGKPQTAKTPIAWLPEQIMAGKIKGTRADGSSVTQTWEEASQDPGWCKLDWVVGDPIRKQLANASNMLDVTWEAPDGSITPLDGYLDPYFRKCTWTFPRCRSFRNLPSMSPPMLWMTM